MKRVTVFFIISVCAFFLSADKYAGKKASLWRENSFVKKMYTDPKASSINDIVVIQISETSTASNKAGLNTSKKSSSSLGINNFFGLENTLKSTNFDPTKMIGHSTEKSNVGTGESTRESALTAYISARVVDIMPNRNMIIEAKKELMVNKEKQIIVLRGIIRPRDISYDNVVQSNNIADMQIRFSGKGPVSEQAKRGWLSWILNLVWPF